MPETGPTPARTISFAIMIPTRASSFPLAARIGVAALLLLAGAVLLFHRRTSPLSTAVAAPSAPLASPTPGPAPVSVSASADARRARDAMREQILDALRKQAASARPAQAPVAQRPPTG